MLTDSPCKEPVFLAILYNNLSTLSDLIKFKIGHNPMKNYFRSNAVSKIILALSILLVILLIFQAGVLMGYRQGFFASNWNGAHGQYMTSPDSIFAPFIHDSDDVNPHGAIGNIVSIHFPSLLIKGPNSAEQVVNISSTTSIRFMHGNASTSDLVPGNSVIIVGEPQSNGSISAAFIRIMPMPNPGGRIGQQGPGTSTISR